MRARITRALAFLLAIAICAFGMAWAEGTETLGLPNVVLAPGTGIVGNGVGLLTQPAFIDFDVPLEASVAQTLIYWNGFHSTIANSDAEILVNGMPVTGTLIGGPTLFFDQNWVTTFRADITGMGIVVPGANHITVSGGDFDQITNGASIIAIIDDGSTPVALRLKDGQDLAFINFAIPLDTTVAQTFAFLPSAFARVAELTVFAGSVEGPVSGADPQRPNNIRVTVGATVTDHIDFLASNNGEEWDHGTIMVAVPAGETQMTVQALSSDDMSGRLPASFAWVGVAMSIPPAEVCGDGSLDSGEGCDPPGDSGGVNGNICRDDCTVCGDGVTELEEECDDGNSDDLDGCRNNCAIPRCGDSITDPGESCDPAGEPGGASGNLCRVDCTVCGDMSLDAGEQCDDGNNNDDDGCRNDCTIPTCGDSMLDAGESCEPPGSPAGVHDAICRNDCTVCGDGVKDPLENCDDGNIDDEDGCRNNCTIAFCGDTILDRGETCDPPDVKVLPNGNPCRDDCTVCGDGITDTEEQCDDGNNDDLDDCRNDCTFPVCGDHFVNGTEQCDDGNNDDTDSCSNDCVSQTCGNGQPDEGETCDTPGDQAGDNGNACRDDCTVCGDAVVDVGEACDDGNGIDSDGCRNNCTIPACNDGIVDSAESCDPPGEVAGANSNACRDDCTACGDNVVNGGEACDDGNGIDDDGCRNNCSAPACGDGTVDAGESCDPSGAPAGRNGNACRDDCTVCGDKVVDPGEACDDGNGVNDDGCRNDCTIPACNDEILDFGETCEPPGQPAIGTESMCRIDCTFCGDRAIDGGEQCDDGNNDDGDGCSRECVLEQVCELAVEKNCFVPEDGDDDDDDSCEGKLLSMKLEYTGGGCAPLANPQSGKATCVGDAGFASPVAFVVSNERGDVIYGENAAVFLGDIFEASAAYAGLGKFDAQTNVTIAQGLEEISFHTSCSKPLAVGNQFGSVRVVEVVSTLGGVVTLPDADAERSAASKDCVIPPVPAAPHCDGKVKGIRFTYLGGSCDESTNPQDGKATCNGDAGLTTPVRVTCFRDGITLFLDTGEPANVNIGDVVEALASNAGLTTFGTQTYCEVSDQFENWVQDVSFHTSCSKPLNLGDRFGSLEVFGLNTTGGGDIAAGHEVIHTYKVTNLSDEFLVQNVTVHDDKLGEISGSPIESLAPGEVVTLQAVALIHEDTVNTVMVIGETEAGKTCPEVSDSATVRVEQVLERIECDGRIVATLLEYVGPNVPGPVTVKAAGDAFRNAPAVYDFPGGLTTGTVLMSNDENGWTLDSTVHGGVNLGTRFSILINGVQEEHHTSCSVPYGVNLPAPLNDPKGDPSTLWLVRGFTQ